MRDKKRKLTIGMCTYDDFNGTYFTIQSIRLYHSDIMEDVEFLVIDNNPKSKDGRMTKKFMKESVPNGRYITFDEYTGCSIRNKIFENANTPYVLCVDCHVMLYPNSLHRLIEYFDNNPNTKDLLHGPLLWEQLSNKMKLKSGEYVNNISTHMEMRWRGGMLGTWASHDNLGYNVDDEPFEIPAHGLGLFACKKDEWLSFNEKFREFGGEEGYIHEKYRKEGRKVLCLPFLRWMHRFYRCGGIPYNLSTNSRVRNYFIGHMELDLPIDPILWHFCYIKNKDNKKKFDKFLLGEDEIKDILYKTIEETEYIPSFNDPDLAKYLDFYIGPSAGKVLM